MVKFRRRPELIEACQFDPYRLDIPGGVEGVAYGREYAPDRVLFRATSWHPPLDHPLTDINYWRLNERGMLLPLQVGDWICTDHLGRRRVSRPRDFERDYEQVLGY